MWDSLLKDRKLAKPAESGKQGEFLCRTGAFTKPDGSQPWICLYTLVKNGHGEGIIFFATDEQHFLTHDRKRDLHATELVQAIGGAAG
jgi:hypothetical protein